MRAIVIDGKGGTDVLSVRDVPEPSAGPGQVLVRVRAAGVNRADVLQRRGFYPAPAGAPASIPGLEYAGEVAAVGPGAGRLGVGDRVMGIVAGGAQAELLVVHEREAVRIPDALSFEDAAAVPEVFMTAWDAAFLQAGLCAGEILLVPAVGSGVGTAALQLAKAAGARVIGTSRTPWKLDKARELGLDVALDGSAPGLADAIRRATGGAGVDVVLDLLGGPALPVHLRALRQGGTLVCVGLLAGAVAELPLGVLLASRLRVLGTVLRSRPLEEKIALARDFERHVVPLLEAGRVAPVVAGVLPLADVATAHARMEADDTFGSLVLTL
jgi:putative PIG3 family NAD(P)H quinone oxidoreductase